jgi:hypothetical protein
MGKFEWTEEAKEAFESLKAYLTSSPILTPPKKHEDMMLYTVATSMVVSVAIVVEREEEGHLYKVQQPVYYIIKVLSDSKIWYPHVQKLLYTLLITSRKLRHYFESHMIIAVIDFPLRDILHNRDTIGHISKWAVELSALNVDFTHEKRSNLKPLLILFLNGQKSNNLRQMPSLTIGRCTLMDHSN